MTIDELKQAFNNYIPELNEWITGNKLTEIKNYKDYKDSETWGSHYRNDQKYFEAVSSHKNIIFGVISYAEMIKLGGDRGTKLEAENLISGLENELKRLDNLLFTARERLRFYENIMRVMGNVTWGSY